MSAPKILTLYPAYNRHYASASIAKSDFLAGQTFKTRDNTHVSIKDILPSTIRIKLPSSSIVFDLKPTPHV